MYVLRTVLVQMWVVRHDRAVGRLEVLCLVRRELWRGLQLLAARWYKDVAVREAVDDESAVPRALFKIWQLRVLRIIASRWPGCRTVCFRSTRQAGLLTLAVDDNHTKIIVM